MLGTTRSAFRHSHIGTRQALHKYAGQTTYQKQSEQVRQNSELRDDWQPKYVSSKISYLARFFTSPTCRSDNAVNVSSIPSLAFYSYLHFFTVTTLCTFLQRHAFIHPARALVKVMSMTTGELDYDDIFHHREGEEEIAFPLISFPLWIIFLVMMPVLLNNYLVRRVFNSLTWSANYCSKWL